MNEILSLVLIGMVVGILVGWILRDAYGTMFNPARDAHQTQNVLPAINKLVKALRDRPESMPADQAVNVLKTLVVLHKDSFGFELAQILAETTYRKEFGLSEKDESLQLSQAVTDQSQTLLLLKWPGLEQPFALAVK